MIRQQDEDDLLNEALQENLFALVGLIHLHLFRNNVLEPILYLKGKTVGLFRIKFMEVSGIAVA